MKPSGNNSSISHRLQSGRTGARGAGPPKTAELLLMAATLAGMILTMAATLATAAKPSQYDLVYLVIVPASEMKAEGKARVEPLFLTDGTRTVFLFDYCRGQAERV